MNNNNAIKSPPQLLQKNSKLFLLIILLGLFTWPALFTSAQGKPVSLTDIQDRYDSLISLNRNRQAIDFLFSSEISTAISPIEKLEILRSALADNANKGQVLELVALVEVKSDDFATFLLAHYWGLDELKPQISTRVVRLAANGSSLIDLLRPEYVFQIFLYVQENLPDLSIEFIETFYHFGYPRIYTYYADIEAWYLELIRVYLLEGRLREAKQVFDSSIHSLRNQLIIWHSNQFKQLWPHLDQKGFSPHAIAKRDRERAIEFIESGKATSDELVMDAATEIIDNYNSIGDFKNAIELGGNLIESLEDVDIIERDFMFLVQEVANSYEFSGDWSTSDALMRSLLEKYDHSVDGYASIKINYAIFLLNRGDHQMALEYAEEVLSNFELTEYGQSMLHFVRACSSERLGRSEQAREIFNDSLDIKAVNFYAPLRAAMCLGKDEAVAELYRQRLQSGDYHEVGIILLSVSSLVPRDQTQAALFNRRNQILDEQGITAELEDYGRIGSWDIPGEYWNEF